MRYVMLAVGVLVLLLVGAALWFDEGEVVQLRTEDRQGQVFETDLWIAEYRGDLYVRGATNRPWVERLRVHPQVELVRSGNAGPYEAQAIDDPEVTAGVDAAISEKYGPADWIAGAIFDRRPPVAIRLDPVASPIAADRGSADTSAP